MDRQRTFWREKKAIRKEVQLFMVSWWIWQACLLKQGHGHANQLLVVTDIIFSQSWWCFHHIHSARGIYCSQHVKCKMACALSNLQPSLTISEVRYKRTSFLCSWAHPQSHSTLTSHGRGLQLHSHSRHCGWFYPCYTDTCLLFLRQIFHSMFMTYSCQTFLELRKNSSW